MGRRNINAGLPQEHSAPARVCGAEHPSGVGHCTRLPGHGDDKHRALIAGRLVNWVNEI